MSLVWAPPVAREQAVRRARYHFGEAILKEADEEEAEVFRKFDVREETVWDFLTDLEAEGIITIKW